MIDLEAIEARAKAATPGPWRVADARSPGSGPVRWVVASWRQVVGGLVRILEVVSDDEKACEARGDVLYQTSSGDLDAEFVAHAREDVPALSSTPWTLERALARPRLRQDSMTCSRTREWLTPR